MEQPALKLRRIMLLLAFSGRIAIFISFFCLTATLIDSSAFISYEKSSEFSEWLYGFSSQENFDDLWFYSDFSISILVSATCYILVMILIRALRRK